MATILSKNNLEVLVKRAREKGYRVVGPARKGELVLFSELSAPHELCLEEINPRNSIKEFFFPKCEKIFSYSLSQKEVNLKEESGFPKTLILGNRPCDAMSLLRMDCLFGWDSRDKFFFDRREATTVVTVACERFDRTCFCTSLGFGPRSREGSDVLLVPLESGEFKVEAVTPKGESFIAEMGDPFQEGEAAGEKVAGPEKEFELERVKPWLEKNFDHPFWKRVSMACVGCGTCTFLCPTCHCFDIVDEGDIREGARFKNWDSCQFKLFTLHTSGHNPRPSQDTRWRQRLRHKFLYYVDKFGTQSCVGCGRCIRHCPVRINILDQLIRIASFPEEETAGAGKKGEEQGESR